MIQKVNSLEHKNLLKQYGNKFRTITPNIPDKKIEKKTPTKMTKKVIDDEWDKLI